MRDDLARLEYLQLLTRVRVVLKRASFFDCLFVRAEMAAYEYTNCLVSINFLRVVYAYILFLVRSYHAKVGGNEYVPLCVEPRSQVSITDFVACSTKSALRATKAKVTQITFPGFPYSYPASYPGRLRTAWCRS